MILVHTFYLDNVLLVIMIDILQQESMVNTFHDRDFVIAADNEEQETPDYYSNESDGLPILQPSQEEV